MLTPKRLPPRRLRRSRGLDNAVIAGRRLAQQRLVLIAQDRERAGPRLQQRFGSFRL